MKTTYSIIKFFCVKVKKGVKNSKTLKENKIQGDNLENSKSSNSKVNSSQAQDNLILLMDNPGTKKYYLINAGFLLFYSSYSIFGYFFSDYPDYLKGSLKVLGGLSTLTVLLMWPYSNRHVKTIIYNKTQKKMFLETFRFYGMLQSKVYTVDVANEVRSFTSLKSSIKIADYGIYFLNMRTDVFSYFNKFIIRPHNLLNRYEFDEVFKKLIHKKV
jgi:hypothetical protein